MVGGEAITLQDNWVPLHTGHFMLSPAIHQVLEGWCHLLQAEADSRFGIRGQLLCHLGLAQVPAPIVIPVRRQSSTVAKRTISGHLSHLSLKLWLLLAVLGILLRVLGMLVSTLPTNLNPNPYLQHLTVYALGQLINLLKGLLLSKVVWVIHCGRH